MPAPMPAATTAISRLRDGEPNAQGEVGLASVLWLPLATTVSQYPRPADVEFSGDQ